MTIQRELWDLDDMVDTDDSMTLGQYQRDIKLEALVGSDNTKLGSRPGQIKAKKIPLAPWTCFLFFSFILIKAFIVQADSSLQAELEAIQMATKICYGLSIKSDTLYTD